MYASAVWTLPSQTVSYDLEQSMWTDTTIFVFRLSEQRVHDLLDGLCNDVSKRNMLYTSAEGNQSWAKIAQPGWTAPSKPEEDGKCIHSAVNAGASCHCARHHRRVSHTLYHSSTRRQGHPLITCVLPPCYPDNHTLALSTYNWLVKREAQACSHVATLHLSHNHKIYLTRTFVRRAKEGVGELLQQSAG